MTAQFEAARRTLTLYHRALAGHDCELVPYADDADLWQHPDTATTLRLPARAPATDLAPSAWYRVAVTHRALHHLLGTFALDLGRPEPLFRALRPAAEPERPALEAFVGSFGRAALAVEAFAVLEDLRVDTAALRLFPGLAGTYRAVQQAALTNRPELALLPPRAAVAEALVRFSLDARTVAVPPALLEPLAAVAAVARRLRDPAATVESTAEATIRVYDVLAGLPNVGVHRVTRPIEFADLDGDVDAPHYGRFRAELRLEGDEKFEVRPHPVRYRDAPGPRYVGQATSGMPLQEAIVRITAGAGEASDEFQERSLAAERGGVDVTATDPAAAPPEPLPHAHGPEFEDHHEGVQGHLHAHARDEYVYPEWDGVSGRYLADWCLVRERRPKPVRSERAHRRALARHGHLLPRLVVQLERVRPVGRDLAVRMPYGDDLDLDACVEALVDLRTGVQPSDRVFASMVERKRDVAVAFALDLSSSTAERLSPDPDDPRDVRRILDLQRDAVSLLAEALDRVGDAYGIYGFSGGGRDDVRVTVVKDVEERRSPLMLHRLQGLVPDHTTRMGPAIRHLGARLERADAATKLLMIVSDGRPFDLDYGQQYGEDAVMDYALADTARAMAEVRARGVQPYLITVDPAGRDYLSRMCDPREYHVISEARELPAALSQLYVIARGQRAVVASASSASCSGASSK